MPNITLEEVRQWVVKPEIYKHKYTLETFEQVTQAFFSPEEQTLIQTAFQAYQAEYPNDERVLLSILCYSAVGAESADKLERLERGLEIARLDWRDALMLAYQHGDKRSQQGRSQSNLELDYASSQNLFQRIFILKENAEGLDLGQFPLIEWLVVLALFLATIGFIDLAFYAGAIVAGGAAAYFFWKSHIRTIHFNSQSDSVQIILRAPRQQWILHTARLTDFSHAEVQKNEKGSMALVLHYHEGATFRLAVPSRDRGKWKMELVIKINQQIQAAHAHKDALKQKRH